MTSFSKTAKEVLDWVENGFPPSQLDSIEEHGRVEHALLALEEAHKAQLVTELEWALQQAPGNEVECSHDRLIAEDYRRLLKERLVELKGESL